MSTEARIRIETQRREDLRRLADQAEQKGVRILHTRDGRHFATSATDATRLYPVGVASGCTCLAAVHGGLCGHLGLLLSELGLIGDDTDEEWLDDMAARETVTTSRWIGGARHGYRDVRTVAAA